jgi:hypothetical protein
MGTVDASDWWEETLAGTAATKDIRIKALRSDGTSTGLLDCEFMTCVPVSFSSAYLPGKQETLKQETLVLYCPRPIINESYHYEMNNWLNDIFEQYRIIEKELSVIITDSIGEEIDRFHYQSSFPIGYIFPVLDKNNNNPMREKWIIKPESLNQGGPGLQ